MIGRGERESSVRHECWFKQSCQRVSCWEILPIAALWCGNSIWKQGMTCSYHSTTGRLKLMMETENIVFYACGRKNWYSGPNSIHQTRLPLWLQGMWHCLRVPAYALLLLHKQQLPWRERLKHSLTSPTETKQTPRPMRAAYEHTLHIYETLEAWILRFFDSVSASRIKYMRRTFEEIKRWSRRCRRALSGSAWPTSLSQTPAAECVISPTGGL